MKRVGIVVGVVAIGIVVAILMWSHDDNREPKTGPTTKRDTNLPTAAERPANDSQPTVQTLEDDDPPGTLRLEGLVLGADDKPVAGAIVTLGSTPPKTATTEADGGFAFDGLLARGYRIVARAPTGIAGPVVAQLSAKSEPVILRLRAGAKLAVTVVSADGRPVDGATVELRGVDTQRQTTKSGDATFAPVVPGPYQLVASAPGLAPAHELVRVAGDTRARMILLPGAAVAGRVVDDRGTAVAGARVVYVANGQWAAQPDPRIDAVVSGADGSWRFPALPAGSFRFVASDDVHAPGTSALVVLDGKTDKTGIDIQLAAGAVVRGKVVDGSKQPVAGARVMVGPGQQRGGRGRANRSPMRQTYSDANGAFVVRGLAKEPLVAMAQHESGSSTPVEVDASAGDPPEVTIVLDLTAAIAGVVVDDAGEPIEGAQVIAVSDRRGFDPARGGPSSAMTDAGGRFKITGLADGDYALRASRTGNLRGGRNRRGGDSVTAHTGDDKVKIVLLAEGSVTGKVAQTDGSAPPVFTASVGVVQQSFVGGAFTLDGLPPGEYRLTISGPSFDSHEQDVTVPVGKTLDVGTIQVAVGRKLAGVVVSNGQPVVGAIVYAGTQVLGGGATNTSPQAGFGGQPNAKQDTTDGSGAFSLAGFGDGDLTIVADLPGVGRSKALRVTADAPNQTALQLELLPYGAISGSLTQGGQPATGVLVTAQSTSTPGAVYTVQAGGDGAYRFDQLAPDTYKVSAMLGTPRRGMHLYSQQVVVASGAEAHVDLTVDPGAVTVTATASSAKPPGIVVGYLASSTLTGPLASDVSLQLAAAGPGASQIAVGRAGEPATFTDVSPGNASVCLIPLPPDLQGRAAQGYLQAHATKLAAFCKPLVVTPTPATQTIDIAVTLPPPAGNGSGT